MITYQEVTAAHHKAAKQIAEKWDRSLANRNAGDTVPVSAETARIVAICYLNLANGGKTPALPAVEDSPLAAAAGLKVKRAATPKAPKKMPERPLSKRQSDRRDRVDPPEVSIPLSAAQRQALQAVQDLLARGELVTSGSVSKQAGWKSRNTANLHINHLIGEKVLIRKKKDGPLVLNPKMILK